MRLNSCNNMSARLRRADSARVLAISPRKLYSQFIVIDSNARESETRLNVDQFIETYQWVNAYLPEDVGQRFETFIDEELVAMYPDDLAEVYAALTGSSERHLRMMAAIGIHNVMKAAPEDGLVLAARLVRDEDPEVSEQARETLRDFPQIGSANGHTQQ